MLRAAWFKVFLRRFVVALVVVAVISGAGIVTANAVWNRKFDSIHTVKLPDNTLTPPGKPGAPANYLIIGSDTRDFVDTPEEAKAFGSAQEVGGSRSDVMMVVHVDPSLGSALVVSFPRDTVVDIPGHGHDKLNAAFAIGGPALAIETFQEAFGIPIQHYLAVNFDGFRKIVDSIGHVKIYFPTPALDVYTGLYQPTAGCHSLDGTEALAYPRSRHYLIPEEGVTDPDPNRPVEDWTEDPRSDLDRILRQQYFLRSLGQTALDHGASNPVTALRLTDAVVKSLSKDQTLRSRELKAMVRTFRGLDPATVEMTTLPVTSGEGGLVAQYPEAQPVLNRLKDLTLPTAPLPTAAPPSSVKVIVVDGSGVAGRAATVQDGLVARGFKAAGAAQDADRTNYRKTQVRYAPGAATKGLVAGLYLGTANVVETASASLKIPDGTVLHGDVIVVVGDDYPQLRGLLTRPVSAATTPTAPTTTSTSTTIGVPGTGPSTSTSTSTSTTVPTPVTTPDTRYVPVSSKGLGPLVGCP